MFGKEVVYRATVTSEEKTETYVGLTATEFKPDGETTICHLKTKIVAMTLN